MQSENLYTPNKIRTYTGKYIDPFNLQPNDIDIIDIAVALARIPRFMGHMQTQISVGQHSIWVWATTPNDFRLEAIMHDASEAYIGDMPKPIKERLPDFKKLEESIMKAIAEKFSFKYPCEVVAEYDKKALEYEWDMFKLSDQLEPYPTQMVIDKFLSAFRKEWEARTGRKISELNPEFSEA